jgi:hypothetical protein
MGVDEGGLVPHHQRPDAKRDGEPFVRVEGDGVGAMDPGQGHPAPARQLVEAPVRGVDVKPETLLRGDAGDLVQRIDRAGVGGACGCDDEKRLSPLGSVGGYVLCQGSHRHAKLGVDFDLHHLVVAETG